MQKNPDTKSTCGFIVTSIDCILIETLEQFYKGTDETLNKDYDQSFFDFFSRSPKLQGIFETKKDAGKFSGLIRGGLLHQAKTKKGSRINIKKTTPIIGWVNNQDKSQGFEINRKLFHDCVLEEFNTYVVKLKQNENSELRKNFKNKLLSIV